MNHPSTSQQVKVRVNVLPTKVRSRISVSKTPRRVVVRTYRSAEARVTVRITAKGPGLRTPTWKRTWRVR